MVVERGRLWDPAGAPGEGERHGLVVRLGEVRVEQIVSGHLPAPETFCQDTDEWVVVLDGSARLEVAGTVHHLQAGDWVLLPAGTPHVLHETAPGTRWLAVHAPGSPTVIGPS